MLVGDTGTTPVGVTFGAAEMFSALNWPDLTADMPLDDPPGATFRNAVRRAAGGRTDGGAEAEGLIDIPSGDSIADKFDDESEIRCDAAGARTEGGALGRLVIDTCGAVICGIERPGT